MDEQKQKKNVKPSEDPTKKIKEELEKVILEKEEFKQKYLRALADYQNFEKRTFEMKNDAGKQTSRQLLLKLLPFLDHLEKAEEFIKDPGLKMIKDQFAQTLKETGLEEILVLGKEYDPFTAEAIEVVPGEVDNMVVEVLRKGYRFHDMILRPAQVKVSKKAVVS